MLMLHRSTALKGFRHHALIIWKLSLDETRHQGGTALPEHQMILQRRHVYCLFLAVSRKTADLLKRLTGHNDSQISPERHGASGLRQAVAIRGHHNQLLTITDHQHATQSVTRLVMGRGKDGLANHFLEDLAIQGGKLCFFDRRERRILFRRETRDFELGGTSRDIRPTLILYR